MSMLIESVTEWYYKYYITNKLRAFSDAYILLSIFYFILCTIIP